MRKTVPGVIAIASVLIVAGCLVAIGIIVRIQTAYRSEIISDASKLQPTDVAIVLGASVKKDGTASDALRDRVYTAAELYRNGKVRGLLLTGDDGAYHVNEVETMRNLAMEYEVPEAALKIDGHGYRTYESCKNAAEIFHVTSSVIVTQNFHLPRALYLCGHFGIRSQGYAADRQTYKDIFFFTVRDWLASALAWWDTHMVAPAPVVKTAGS